MQASLAGTPVAASRARGWTACVLFAAATFWFYTWEPSSYPRQWFSARPQGFYNELADAFLAGQASLLRQPDPRLAALTNPYDPAQNAAYRVNDLSYFKGRYYLYMGPAPAVDLFVPFKLITGRYLTEKAACSLLGVIGAVASASLLYHLYRRCLPGTPAAMLVISMAALALADGYYVAIRGTLPQQVTIAHAYAFAMLSLWAGARALTSEAHPRAWFALSSLCLGIAIASRPNYVFASAALIPPFIFWLNTGGGRPASRVWSGAAAVALPLAGVVAMLLTYNWVRFGQFLEFGPRYQLGGWNQLGLSSTGLGHGWENAWRYLFAPASYTRTFPFVTAPTWIAVSVLRHVPWLWLSPVAAWMIFRKGTPPPVRAAGISALILASANLVTLVFLPSGNPAAILTSANARYLLDFQPGLTLFVALGMVAAWEPGALGRRPLGRLIVPVAAALVASSAIIALSLDIGTFPPEASRTLAYVLDLPAYGVELARGYSYGPIAADVTFPADRTGAYEPLLSTGSEAASDLLFVHYVSATQIQLGLVNTEMRGPVSDPLTVANGVPHHLTVSMGSLYPPYGHPRWSSLSEPQVSYLMRSLHVEIDGRAAIDTTAHFHPSSPDQVELGRNRFLPGTSSASFSGRIAQAHRLPLAAPLGASPTAVAYGPVRLRLRLPDVRAVLTREPLVVTGVPRAGDIVFVQYLDKNRIRLGVDHWGSAAIESEPLALGAGGEHTIVIAMGSLFPVNSAASQERRIQILLDGARVLDSDQHTYDSSPHDVFFGINAIGGSTCGYAFTGRILSVERVADRP